MTLSRRSALSLLPLALTACLHTRGVARPRQGELIRELALPGDDGTIHSLQEAVAAHRAVVLVFYRGHW